MFSAGYEMTRRWNSMLFFVQLLSIQLSTQTVVKRRLRTSQAVKLIAVSLVVSRPAGKRTACMSNRFHSIPKTLSYNSHQ